VGTEVTVRKLPECDLCDAPARYDARTVHRGAWAYLCEPCWRLYGVGRLGTGYGQRLVLESEATPDREDRP
jgi:hypothetical protein